MSGPQLYTEISGSPIEPLHGIFSHAGTAIPHQGERIIAVVGRHSTSRKGRMYQLGFLTRSASGARHVYGLMDLRMGICSWSMLTWYCSLEGAELTQMHWDSSTHLMKLAVLLVHTSGNSL